MCWKGAFNLFREYPLGVEEDIHNVFLGGEECPAACSVVPGTFFFLEETVSAVC